jgi:adenosylcobinamide kinase / adenosylcobinamide-phosphate guanylyltransferase
MNETTGTLTLILGGARSGKSAYAEEQARSLGEQVLFVATATAGDEEMEARIQKHRASRPTEWETLEARLDTGRAILSRESPVDVVILDCVTLLVSNILLELPENSPAEVVIEKVSAELEALLKAYAKTGGEWLIISNEVGLGLVPVYALGRVYRDALGWANQRLAKAADRVIFMVAGIPTVIKG